MESDVLCGALDNMLAARIRLPFLRGRLTSTRKTSPAATDEKCIR
jgi:hypothetical protein